MYPHTVFTGGLKKLEIFIFLLLFLLPRFIKINHSAIFIYSNENHNNKLKALSLTSAIIEI
jgi:hypothetical protein